MSSPSSALEAVRVGIATALGTNITQQSAVVPVLTDVPDNQTPPWVEIATLDERNDDTHDQYGAQLTVTIHAWTDRGSDYTRCSDLLSQVRGLLHRQSLTLSDVTHGGTYHDSTSVVRDEPSGRVHGVSYYIVIAYGL